MWTEIHRAVLCEDIDPQTMQRSTMRAAASCKVVQMQWRPWRCHSRAAMCNPHRSTWGSRKQETWQLPLVWGGMEGQG